MAFLALPQIEAEYGHAEANPRLFWMSHVPVVAGMTAAFFLPLVRRFTGADPWPIAIGVAGHLLIYGWAVHGRIDERYPRGYALLVCLVNTVVFAIPAATTDRAWTPLWLLYFIYTIIAAAAFGFNAVILAILVAVPVAVAFLPWSLTGLLPLHQTLPDALLLMGCVVAAYVMLGTAFESIARSRQERRVAERQAATDAERRRVAHDLHATLGAALSEVTLWQNVAAGAQGTRSTEALARAQARAREALAELRTTVHGLAGGEVTPEALEGRLRGRLGGLGDAAAIAMSLSVTDGVPLESIRAYHIQRFVEEAAVNAIRHAGARSIEIAIDLEPLRAVVRDDGCGFAPASAARGHGLTALAAHAEALGARVEFRSGPGPGTEVLLLAPPSEARVA